MVFQVAGKAPHCPTLALCKPANIQSALESSPWLCKQSFVARGLRTAPWQGTLTSHCIPYRRSPSWRHAGCSAAVQWSSCTRTRPLRCQATSEGAHKEGTVTVRISTQHQVAFGEVIKLVGSGAALGDWNTEAGPVMEWGDGDNWSVSLEIPPGEFNFKCVVMRADGSVAAWEPGSNRTLEVPHLPDADPSTVMEVICPWSDTSATFMSFDEDDVAARAEAAAQQSNAAEEGTRKVEEGPGLARLDADHQEDTTPIEDKIEQVAEAILRGEDSQENSKPSPPTESGSKSEPVEGLARLDADSVEDSTPIEQKIEEVAEAMGLGGAERKSNAESPPAAPSVSKETTSTKPAEQAGSENGSAASTSAPSSTNSFSAATTAPPQEVATGVQSVAIGVGLVALPLVAWSEYTLKATGYDLEAGCGLPPGPGGILGAAEGIAYVAMLGIVAWAFVKKVTTGTGLPSGPGGLLGAVEGLSYATLIAGIAVLGFQLKDYGYIPAALPDSHCFGGTEGNLKPIEETLMPVEETLPKSSRPFPRGKVALSSDPAKLPLGFLGGRIDFQKNLTELRMIQSAEVVGDLAQAESQAGATADSQAGAAAESQAGDPVKAAIESLQSFFDTPDQLRLELQSGVEDGLSSADLVPIVEDVDKAIANLTRFFSNLRERLAGAAKPVVGGEAARDITVFTTEAMPSIIPLAHIEAPSLTWALSNDDVHKLTQNINTDLRFQADSLAYATAPEMRLVGMDMSISVAATQSAVSAANNVTQNLNTAVLQLQSTVDGVRHVLDDVAEASAGGGLDLSKLSSSVTELQGELGKAQETSSLPSRLGPLVAQLTEAAASIRQTSGIGDASLATAEKLEAAAARLREAADAIDVPAIASAADTVQRKAGSLQEDGAQVTEVVKESAPVVKNVGKVTGLLRDALTALGSITSSDDGNLPSAPQLAENAAVYEAGNAPSAESPAQQSDSSTTSQ